ncbi:RNA polymerase II accessory factor CDC73 [Babesia ovata]|uniref:RNA polymerase II accessory factor CDC73 n=1 Tax=Babesia ovata TaxID=189622 RepID=A0A2H6KF90_9APIC|nr:RNA polymerase II accessory factor CDC73 [Babesia ovata]GBE61656.1 RNA polymerase II accessory factor CDC73 [Babesia ovata]
MEGSQQLFDADWDVRSTQEHNASYWSGKASMPSIALLKSICANGGMVEFEMDPSGVLVCHIPDHKVTVNMLDPSGLRSRRGEAYVIGDIVLLLCIRREDYTYSSITKRGFKYINVLERDRIKSILGDPDTSPDLLEAKARFIPISGTGSNRVTGSRNDVSDSSTSPQVTSKHMIDVVMKKLEESWRTFRQDTSPEDDEGYRSAKKRYYNMCVLAAGLMERPLRTRTSVIMAHGEGFERFLQKLEAAQANKLASKARDAPKSVGNVLRTRELSGFT